MPFDLPIDTIFPVNSVSVRLVDGPHPFEGSNARAIEENWQREIAANPALFDGKVMLLSSLRLRGKVLEGECHLVRFASFMFWRAIRPSSGAGHAYTHAMPVSSDNALIAVRMGPKTANANQIYFAAGTFDKSDIRDGMADPEINMRREVLEETGIDLAGVRHEPGYHAVSKLSGTVLFRRYFLDEPAEQIAERIRAHIAAEDNPEIVEPVIIRSANDLPSDLASQMPDLIAWHFGEGAG